jgi:hypothetical protein
MEVGHLKQNTDSKSNQSIFVRYNNILYEMEEQKADHIEETRAIIRCPKCGFPLKREKQHIAKLEASSKNFRCQICSRERVFSIALNISYLVSLGLFVTSFIGVIIDQMRLDLFLLIGCLLIILLIFLGRLFEIAIFAGLNVEEKIIGSFYRYSISGDVQAFDIGSKLLKKLAGKEISSDLLLAILQVISFRNAEIPSHWLQMIAIEIKMDFSIFYTKLQTEVLQEKNDSYIRTLIKHASPSGFTQMAKIILPLTRSFHDSFESKFKQEFFKANKPKDQWLTELFIEEQIYQNYILPEIDRNIEEGAIEKLFTNYKEPKVPSFDVLDSGKNIINQSPFLRYLVRIAVYIGLAFLIGLIYQLLE